MKRPKNNTYPFSDELSGDDPKKKFDIQYFVGKSVVCEDGIARRVDHICNAYGFPGRAIINERDPESRAGWFVSLLSLGCQYVGDPLPTKEQEIAFLRLWVRPKVESESNGEYTIDSEGRRIKNPIYEAIKKKIQVFSHIPSHLLKRN